MKPYFDGKVPCSPQCDINSKQNECVSVEHLNNKYCKFCFSPLEITPLFPMMILRETFADVCNDNTADCIPESQIQKNVKIIIFNDY